MKLCYYYWQREECLMFFRKKQKVDLDAKFKEVYREVNKITADAGNELDVTIKYSQLKLACRKYDELIDLIHRGANFEEKHFLSLKESVEEETKRVEGLLDED